MTIKEMRSKREAHMNTMRSIVERATTENRALTVGEQKDFDGLKAKMEELGGTLDRASQLGEMRADIESPIVAGQIVQQDGMTYGTRNHNPGEVRAYKPNEAMSETRYNGAGIGAYVRGIVTGRWNGAEELRALAEGSTPGSYLVPTPLAGYIIDLIRNQAQVMRAGALTIPMETATLKVACSAADVTSAWKAENAAMTYSDANLHRGNIHAANTLIAGSKLSIEMVEDAINLDDIRASPITKIARPSRWIALYGSGSEQPAHGNQESSGVTLTNLTNGLTFSELSKYSSGITTLLDNN